MNEHTFCFIICTNNQLLLDECIHYLQQLTIPDGYNTELLTITDATSMTAGYMEGMAASEAKYKIYLHQDVFILNQNFLADLLSIFHSDPEIGMIGMTGYQRISTAGIMWYEKQLGNFFHSSSGKYPERSAYRYSLFQDGYDPVALIDGFLIATCHDLPWNTADLQGWDFYDAYQSICFLENGYKIAVPRQRYPWCIHDDGGILNMNSYNKYRHMFLHTYSHYLGKSYQDILNTSNNRKGS